MRFVKRPVVIDAVQFKSHDMMFPGRCDCSRNALPHIHTLEGMMVPEILDWIITGIEGEHYSCRSSIFEKTYEKV